MGQLTTTKYPTTVRIHEAVRWLRIYLSKDPANSNPGFFENKSKMDRGFYNQHGQFIYELRSTEKVQHFAVKIGDRFCLATDPFTCCFVSLRASDGCFRLFSSFVLPPAMILYWIISSSLTIWEFVRGDTSNLYRTYLIASECLCFFIIAFSALGVRRLYKSYRCTYPATFGVVIDIGSLERDLFVDIITFWLLSVIQFVFGIMGILLVKNLFCHSSSSNLIGWCSEASAGLGVISWIVVHFLGSLSCLGTMGRLFVKRRLLDPTY